MNKNLHYVILRDDDINALTPVECLERLYRPFLDLGLPVNLAVIPEVRISAARPDGQPEGFLFGKGKAGAGTVPIAEHPELPAYLRAHPGYHVLQHGCHHDAFEFDCHDREEVARKLEQGRCRLREAGLDEPSTFVAPHDKMSRPSLLEVSKRFRVLSTGWFELRRLPPRWWLAYALKKLRNRPHWRVGRITLLTHPGCLLSCHRPHDRILSSIDSSIDSRRLTVLVTHWWEYFRDGRRDDALIRILHQTAARLAERRDVKVIPFEAVAAGMAPLQ